MTITHHLDDATLMSHAAGALPAALAAVAAAHVSMCARCRGELLHFEAIGGALMANVEPVPMVRREPTASRSPGQHRQPAAHAPSGDVPAPLARLLGSRLDAIRWKHLAPGLSYFRPALQAKRPGNLFLVKAAPGCSIPAHGHNGTELTLVLQGAYHDKVGNFRVGDVADLDEEIDHHPVADGEGCICVVASERPARYHGLLARLYAPLRGI